MPKTSKYDSIFGKVAPSEVGATKPRAKRRTPAEMAVARSETERLKAEKELLDREYRARMIREEEARHERIRKQMEAQKAKEEAAIAPFLQELTAMLYVYPAAIEHFKRYISTNYGYSTGYAISTCRESYRQYRRLAETKKLWEELKEKHKGEEPTDEDVFTALNLSNGLVKIDSKDGAVRLSLAQCCGSQHVPCQDTANGYLGGGNRIVWQYRYETDETIKMPAEKKLTEELVIQDGTNRMVINWGDQ